MALGNADAEGRPPIPAAFTAAGTWATAATSDTVMDAPLVAAPAIVLSDIGRDQWVGTDTASPGSPTLARQDVSIADQGGAGAEAPRLNPVEAGILSSFAFPAHDLLVRKKDSPILDILDGLTVAPGLALPISSQRVGAGTSGDRLSGSSTLSLGLHYQPVGFWYAQITVLAYLEPKRRSSWNGDFTYGFGYDDYHPYTFSLSYSNYGDNRFRPNPNAPISELDHGTISLAWKAPLPNFIARPFLIDQTLSINCHIGVDASPRYDTSAGSTGNWKTSTTLACNYPFTAHLFVALNASVYAHGQQPWDPDFTYTFGLADYRTDHFSIIYANYSGNRYPGRRLSPNTGRFIDGGVFINWNHGF
jgi:hypothetical protein